MMRLRGALGLGLCAVALCACGASADRAERVALAALAIKPPSSPVAPPRGREPQCGDLTASLRPPAAIPVPGAMPAGSFMAQIRRRGYLIAGIDQNTMLFAYFNPLDQRLEGFEIDLLHTLAQAIFGDPNAVHFKAITTTERIPAVRDGSVDVVADAMTITCARKRQVDFSSVYYDAGQRILVPSNSGARSAAELGGRPVCVTSGSTSLTTLEALVPRPAPYKVPQRTDCLVALQQGVVDAITSDDSILLGFRAQDPFTKVVGPRLADEPYGMAIRQDHPDFVRFVNGVLAQMRSDGAWRAIYAHWLGRFTAVPAPPTPHYAG